MRITVEFESLEEFQQHFGTTCAPAVPVDVWTAAPEPQEVAPEPQEVAPEAPVAISWEKPEDAVEAKAPKITEDFRVEVRKTLAALNKVQTGNPAKALIAEIGYKRLTDVPLELLPGLMEKAKGAMNNA